MEKTTSNDSSQTPKSWDWDYLVNIPRIDALYRKSCEEQWSASESIDWSQTVDPSNPPLSPVQSMPISPDLYRRLSPSQQERLMAGLTAATFSQLLHGEQGAMMVSSQLVEMVPTFDLKLFATAQASDEARHLDVFARYVRRQREIFPPTPPLRRILDAISDQSMWQGAMVGMQVVIEGLALSSFLDMRQTTSCPLLKSILDLVIKDEARHLAFGKISLREHVNNLSAEERNELEIFTARIVREFRNWGAQPEDAVNYCQILIEADIDPTDMLAALQQNVIEGQPLNLSRGMQYSFQRIILPDLAKLGLITPETEQHYQDSMRSELDDLGALAIIQSYLEN